MPWNSSEPLPVFPVTMNMLATLLTAAGLGLGAGVNAYATVVVYGLLARYFPGSVPGQYASVFASTPVIVVAAVLYTIEFVADKVPGIDHIWDVIHSFIRPIAGAALGVASVASGMPKSFVVIAGLVAGGAALTSHIGKAATRLASTATTGGAANPLLSIGEDVLAVGGSLIAVFLPYLVLALAAIAVVILGFAVIARREKKARAATSS